MKTYEFELVLAGEYPDITTLSERTYAVGCDDGAVYQRAGLSVLMMDREAESLDEAILSTIRALARAQIDVERVEPSDLVSQAALAERADVSRNAVSYWVTGERGEGFPRPVAGGSGKRLWRWSQVADWLASRKLISEELAVDAHTIADINGALEIRAALGRAPDDGPARMLRRISAPA